jgi:hypothetical protein
MTTATNAEGPEGANLTHALKRTCSNCGGTTFQIEDVTSNAGAGEGIYILCQCGYEELITFDTMGATLNYSE